jgi:hypothetical protein
LEPENGKDAQVLPTTMIFLPLATVHCTLLAVDIVGQHAADSLGALVCTNSNSGSSSPSLTAIIQRSHTAIINLQVAVCCGRVDAASCFALFFIWLFYQKKGQKRMKNAKKVGN